MRLSAAGRLTAAQKQERLEELRERVTAMVNGERPEGGPARVRARAGGGPWS